MARRESTRCHSSRLRFFSTPKRHRKHSRPSENGSFSRGNDLFPHGNGFITDGYDSTPNRNEPQTHARGRLLICSRSKRDRNDANPHGGAEKPMRFVARLIGFEPTPLGLASKPFLLA